MSWREGEELAPVGARVEGAEAGFDLREDGADCGPLGLPGEVNSEGAALVGHAHPEVVGSDGTEFGDEEVWVDLVTEGFDGADGGVGVVERDEVFGLEFLAAGGGEVHAEVGQALVPGAGDAELFGAGFGGVAEDGVHVLGGAMGSEEFGAEGGGRVGLGRTLRRTLIRAAFDPDLGDAGVLPVGEERDAVA